MKKAFNVTVKIIKGYLIFNTICLAFIGAGEILDEFRNNPEDSILDNDDRVFDRAITKYKKFFKGEA